MPSDHLPDALTLDEAYRSAFYLVLGYFERSSGDRTDLVELVQYLWTDPARWSDWQKAIGRALADGGFADPDHEGQWQDRPDWSRAIRGPDA